MSSHDFALSQLLKSCQKLCEDKKLGGFTEIEPRSLQKLAMMLRFKLEEHANSTRVLMEHAGRTQPSVMDVEYMLKMKKVNLKDIINYAKFSAPKVIVEKLPQFPVHKEFVIDDPPKVNKNLPIIQNPEPKKIPRSTSSDFINYENISFEMEFNYESEDSWNPEDSEDSEESDFEDANDFGPLHSQLFPPSEIPMLENLDSEVFCSEEIGYDFDDSWEEEFERLAKIAKSGLQPSSPSKKVPEDSKGFKSFDVVLHDYRKQMIVPPKNLMSSEDQKDSEDRKNLKMNSAISSFQFQAPEDLGLLLQGPGQENRRMLTSEDVKILETSFEISTLKFQAPEDLEASLDRDGHENKMMLTLEDVKNLETNSRNFKEVQDLEDSDVVLRGFGHQNVETTPENLENLSTKEVMSSKISRVEVKDNNDSERHIEDFGHQKLTTTTSEDVKIQETAHEFLNSEVQELKDSEHQNDIAWNSEEYEVLETNFEELEDSWTLPEDFGHPDVMKQTLDDHTDSYDLLDDYEHQKATKTNTEDVKNLDTMKITFSENLNSEVQDHKALPEDSKNQSVTRATTNDAEIPETNSEIQTSEVRDYKDPGKLLNDSEHQNLMKMSPENEKILETSFKIMTSEVQDKTDSETILEGSPPQNLKMVASEDVKILETKETTSSEILTSELQNLEDPYAFLEGYDYQNDMIFISKGLEDLETNYEICTSEVLEDSEHQNVTTRISEDVKILETNYETFSSNEPNMEKSHSEFKKSRKSKKDKSSRKRKVEESENPEDSQIENSKKARQETPPMEAPKLRLTLKISRELIIKSTVKDPEDQKDSEEDSGHQNLKMKNSEDVVDSENQWQQKKIRFKMLSSLLEESEHQNKTRITSEDQVDSDTPCRPKKKKSKKNRRDSEQDSEHQDMMMKTSEDVGDSEAERRQKKKKSKKNRKDSEHQTGISEDVMYSKPETLSHKEETSKEQKSSEVPSQKESMKTSGDSGHPDDVIDNKSLNSEESTKHLEDVKPSESESNSKKSKKNKKKRTSKCPFLF